MTNLVPPWIAQAVADHRKTGSFTAEGLFLDISGFTAMTEALMLHGKDGAEALSKVINEVFDPVLAEIEAGGGFVTTFAGDAFTALFPVKEGKPSTLLDTSLRILNVFQRQPDRKTPWGEFALQAKLGLGCGSVDWGILGQEGTLGYFFRGPAVDSAAEAEHHCRPGTLAWGPTISLSAPEGAQTVTDGEYTVVQPGLASFSPRQPPARPALNRDLVARFLPVDRFPQGPGEFRNLSSAFVTFDEGARPLEDVYQALSRCSRENGGFFNLLDFGDKGGIALVLFGAPVSLEANGERASDFALSLVRALPEVRVGIAQGQCFTGYVGSPLRLTYTALGQVVNLSARLATSARPGEILLPQKAAGFSSSYQLKDLGERTFKGFARPVSVSQLLAKAESHLTYSLAAGVGRSDELRQLKGWIESVARQRQGGAFVVQGEAGLGKTQLAADALSALSSGITYQILQCDPVFPRGFNPFQGIFAGFFGPGPHLEAAVTARLQNLLDGLSIPGTPDYLDHEIHRAGPALLHLAGLETLDADWNSLDPQARHDRTIEALVAYWSLLAQKQPLILVIENAQALDKDTAEFLERVLSRDADLPLGVLLLSREPVSLSLPHGVTALHLGPFTAEDALALERKTLGAEPTPRLVELLDRRSSRIPLYLAELLRYLKENSLVTVVQNAADFKQESETGLPRSLEDLILAQVDHLPPALKSVLPALAVLGNSFSKTVAAALLGEGSEALLRQAQDEGILQRTGEGNLSFKKEFLRETVYQLQLGDSLRELHGRCALVLETVYAEPSRSSGEKAYHFDRARKFEKARDYFRLSADEAAGDFRNREALTAFDRFLDLSQDNKENSLVRLQKARILEHVGDWKAARVELERGIGLAALSGQEEQYHRFFAFLGQIQFKQGDSAGAKASLEKAIRDPRSTGLGPELVQSRIDLARVHLLGGQYGEALGRLLEAKDLAVEQKYDEEEGLALYYLGVVYRVRNRKAEAMATYQKSLEIFKRLGKDRLIAYPLYDLSLMYQHEGALDQAKTFMEEAYRIYTQIGYKSGLGAALLNLGAIEDQRGNFEAAMDAFRRSRHITEEMGEDLGTAYALFSLGASAYKQREYPRALAALQEAHGMIERLEAESYKGYTLSYLASVFVKLGRGDDAAAHIRRQGEVMAKIGDDVEKGRAYLAMAEVLTAGLALSASGQADLQAVVQASGAPRASASWFYQAAIRSAREANYINTLIPATYEYGLYLKAKGRQDLGDKAIRQAWSRAAKGGWTVYTQRLETKHPELLGLAPKESA